MMRFDGLEEYTYTVTDHVLDEPGEFAEVRRGYGLGFALTCWVNTHPCASMVLGGSAGIALVLIGLLLASAAGLL